MEKWILALCLLCALPAFSSIIKKPPVKQEDLSYKELACNEEDQSHIYEIISTMAEHGKLSLLFKQNHLRELGAHIDHIHPLKFMSTIFTNPHLKMCMTSIWDDSFKRSGFMAGLGPSLTVEAEKGKLTPYIKDFAENVKVSQEGLKPYFDARDWEGLVYFLIHS